MKSIFRASNSLEANIVKGLLESNGINAFLSGEHANAAYGGLVSALDTRIMVDDDDEVRAKRIIVEYQDQ